MVIVIEADATRDKNHNLYDLLRKLNSKNGNNIVGEPKGNDSGVDHQNMNVELDKKKSPRTKAWIFFKPILIDMQYINNHVILADNEVTS